MLGKVAKANKAVFRIDCQPEGAWQALAKQLDVVI
jgi:hypothetical protein